jgi:hypothetical protein
MPDGSGPQFSPLPDGPKGRLIGALDLAFLARQFCKSPTSIFFTFPFVLSWSMLESMSAGCGVVGSKTPPVEEWARTNSAALSVL